MIILPNQVVKALECLEKAGFEAYVVGSCLRELILGNNPQDYDIITNAAVNDILFTFRDYRISDEGLARGEVLVTVVGMIIEIAPYRREVVGNRVIYADDLETDLARRGFTMNAMAYSPAKGLIDPYGGKSCLVGEEHKVVAVGENITITKKENGRPVTESYYDMSKSFTMEPSRILKAIRYCSEREFVIEDATSAAMQQNSVCFNYAEPDKVFAELKRIVMGKYAAKVLEKYSDILKDLIPEIEPCIDFNQHDRTQEFTVWTHICRSVGFAVPEPATRFAMLFHDIGKPDCCAINNRGDAYYKGHCERGRLLAEDIMRRMNFDRALMEEVSWLVYHHNVDIPSDRKELKLLIDKLGSNDLKKLIECEIADARAKQSDTDTEEIRHLRKCLADLNEIIENDECYNIHQLAVTKRDLYDRKLVKNDQEADELLKVLFEIALDKPSFNNKLILLDMAEKSKKRAEELAYQNLKKQEEQMKSNKKTSAKKHR